MPIESNGHSSFYNKRMQELLARFPEGFQEKTQMGKGMEEGNENGNPRYVNHIAKKGDTKYGICKKYGITQEQFNLWNNNAAIKSDMQYIVGIYHKVSTGETVYAICKKYGMEENQFKELNGMKDNNLSKGQEYLVYIGKKKESSIIATNQKNDKKITGANNQKPKNKLKIRDQLGKVSQYPYIYDPIPGVERGPSMPSKVAAIILHRTVSSNGQRQYEVWKKEKNPAATHFLIGEDGTVYQTARLSKTTIHLRSGSKRDMYPEYYGKILNSNTIGIEVIGDYPEDTEKWDDLTPEQVISTEAVVRELMRIYNLNFHQLLPHEKVQKKTEGEGQVVYDAIIHRLKDWIESDRIKHQNK